MVIKLMDQYGSDCPEGRGISSIDIMYFVSGKMNKDFFGDVKEEEKVYDEDKNDEACVDLWGG